MLPELDADAVVQAVRSEVEPDHTALQADPLRTAPRAAPEVVDNILGLWVRKRQEMLC
jgi:hypothetical protein